MRDYTKIKAWQFADDLTVSIYDATKTFPREELYGLTSQLRRAASSTAANIVEGSARASQKDYLHFLQIARASLAETHYFIHLAARLGYLNDAGKTRLTSQANQTFACLHGLMQCVEREATATKTPPIKPRA